MVLVPGMGTNRESEGKTLVNDDFELVAFDFVSNPSTRGAFLEPVNLNESVTDKNIVTTEECVLSIVRSRKLSMKYLVKLEKCNE